MHSLPGVHFHLPILPCFCPPSVLSLSQSVVSHRLWGASGKYLLPVSCLAFLVFVSCFAFLFFAANYPFPQPLALRETTNFTCCFVAFLFFLLFWDVDVGERAGCDFRCNKIESRSESTLKALWPSPPSVLSPTEIRHFMVTALFFILCTLLPSAPAPLC